MNDNLFQRVGKRRRESRWRPRLRAAKETQAVEFHGIMVGVEWPMSVNGGK